MNEKHIFKLNVQHKPLLTFKFQKYVFSVRLNNILFADVTNFDKIVSALVSNNIYESKQEILTYFIVPFTSRPIGF
jgi:hypothetical protein